MTCAMVDNSTSCTVHDLSWRSLNVKSLIQSIIEDDSETTEIEAATEATEIRELNSTTDCGENIWCLQALQISLTIVDDRINFYDIDWTTNQLNGIFLFDLLTCDSSSLNMTETIRTFINLVFEPPGGGGHQQVGAPTTHTPIFQVDSRNARDCAS
eukprot:SAG31_NODE_790_length_12082_cov_8.754319_14_plen_155_part_01